MVRLINLRIVKRETLNNFSTVNVGGLQTACVTRKELVDICVDKIATYRLSDIPSKPYIIFDSNGHGISLANHELSFFQSLQKADLIHADGQSVVSMSSWVDGPNIPERSATTDTIHDIPLIFDKQIKHFLLGGKKQVVEKCAQILSAQYKNFEMVGTHDGYFDKDTQSLDVIAQINNSQADILWVGLGKPQEQAWVIKYKEAIKVPVIISCGGCYNYVTGDYARAPMWMQNMGIEWLHRALTEPKKFLWRYITTNPHSIYCVLKHKYANKKVK